MSFVSPEFALAALLFFPLYWRLHASKNLQLAFLLLGSYALYASWSTTAAMILAVYSLGIWLLGNWLNVMPAQPLSVQRGQGPLLQKGSCADPVAAEKKGAARLRRLRLSIGLLLALSVLLLGKYYEFFRQTAGELLPQLGLQALLPAVDFAAPVGVSFYTFQAITYLVWRYREPSGAVGPLRPLVFLSFWPTLFAGPILRAENFFRQADETSGLPREAERAIYLIFAGLVQKMVFANWLAETFVDQAFRYPDQLDALSALAAIWGYSLQIFLDFAGYSLIVTGLGLLLGYEIPCNFRQPYLARSLREFWQGWHITLSTFIRDYIYIPLGGNRGSFSRTQFNLLVAMLLSGIWHGANTTFLLWGLLHGLGVVFLNLDARLWQRCCGRTPPPLPLPLARFLTLIYVSLAWVFFRAASCEEAWQMLAALRLWPEPFAPSPEHAGLLIFTLVFFIFSLRAERFALVVEGLIQRMGHASRCLAGTLAAYAIIYWGPSGIPAFIYYQF